MAEEQTWDYNSNIVPIEELSAYSLYQVQRSLNEWEEKERAFEEQLLEKHGSRSDMGDIRKYGKNHTPTQKKWWGQRINREWYDLKNARERYNEGEKHTLEHEYRYLVSEQDFLGEGGVNSESARAAAAEAEAAAQAELDAEPNRIDQEYADGIGAVNQALADSTLADDFMGEPVDPTNRIIEAEPVSISNPEESSSARLGGINAFKSAPATVRTIKNQSINI